MLPYYLIKLFTHEEHAAAFRGGEIYARKLRCFRKEESEGRGDQAEGTIVNLHLKDQKLTLTAITPEGRETIDITGEDIAAPVTMGSDAILDLNVFCMVGLYKRAGSENTHQIDLPERCFREFGNYAVVIFGDHVKQFINRVQVAAKREGYQVSCNRVTYYDPTSFDGLIPEDRAPFSKPKKFEYQQEFRLVFDTKKPGTLKLNVGGLSDISGTTKVVLNR